MADRIKYYNELKSEDDKLVDLTLTASKYQQIVDGMLDTIPQAIQEQAQQAEEEPITVSASGLIDTSYPVAETKKDETDYDKLEAMI